MGDDVILTQRRRDAERIGAVARWDRFALRHPVQAFLMFCFVCGIIVWGGENGGKGNAPVVTQKGIKWKSVNVTPQGISAEWESEDSRIPDGAEYIIEYRKKAVMLGDSVVENPEDYQWREFARTKDKAFAKECWMLDSTFDRRVRTVVQEGAAE